MRRQIRAALAPAATLWLAVAMGAAVGSVSEAADDRRPGADRFPNVTLTTQDGATGPFLRRSDQRQDGRDQSDLHDAVSTPARSKRRSWRRCRRLLGDRMGRDIFFYSITIDPEHDTPAVLKEYAEKYHAGPGWLFLTGKTGGHRSDQQEARAVFAARPVRTRMATFRTCSSATKPPASGCATPRLDNPRLHRADDWRLVEQLAERQARPVKSYAEARRRLKMTAGQYTFANHCAACHTIGRGDRIGPDLRGVTDDARSRLALPLHRRTRQDDGRAAIRSPCRCSPSTSRCGCRISHLTRQDAADDHRVPGGAEPRRRCQSERWLPSGAGAAQPRIGWRGPEADRRSLPADSAGAAYRHHRWDR